MIFSYLELILIIFICTLIVFLYQKYRVFKNITKDHHQNFTYKEFILPVGGYLLITSIIVLNFSNINLEFIYLLLIFIVGALSDLKKFNSPKYRLFVQSALILLFVYQFQIELTLTRLQFLDSLLENIYFNVFFVSFCILIVINGTNFIDGLNGLVLIYYLCISLIILNSGLEIQLFGNENFLSQLVAMLLCLLLLNNFNKLYLGDSGSYLIGFLFAIILLKIYLSNQYISPFFIILLLWYPCFENLFSIIRKYRHKKSPIKPDTNHLHQLLFYYLNKKIKFKNKLICNNFSSAVINFYNLVVFLLGFNQLTKTNVQVVLILFNILIYLIIYSKLFIFRYKDFKKINFFY